jgi:hypothetical protein
MSKQVLDQANIGKAFAGLPPESYSQLQANSAAWHQLRRKLLAHDDMFWSITAVCCPCANSLTFTRQGSAGPITGAHVSDITCARVQCVPVASGHNAL